MINLEKKMIHSRFSMIEGRLNFSKAETFVWISFMAIAHASSEERF